MRQMNQTGYMHNRARLVTCSFVIKDLLLSWDDSEKYFAQTLVDYDISVNNGNHQWVAGTGASHMPTFRVFNPWIQSKKYDPDATYIKKWVPELKDVPAKDIHNWNKTYQKYPDTDYPEPIVDHDEQKKKILKMYNV
jgi:deoxyribodipyrimidine photo-lyase